MSYNKNVQKARASVGKDEMERRTEARIEARRKMEAVYSSWSPAIQGRVRAVYSLLLNKGPQTVPQLEEWIGVNTSGVSKLMNGMKDMGVVKAEKVDEGDLRRSAPLQWSVVADAEVPAAWMREGRLSSETLHAHETYVRPSATAKRPGPGRRAPCDGTVGFASESVIAQSMASSKRVDVGSIGPYEDLVVALASINLERSNAEIKGWLRELTGLAERRIREAKVKCPACGAVLETYKVTGLRCPRCRAEADGGTTEVSLAMLGALIGLKEGSA